MKLAEIDWKHLQPKHICSRVRRRKSDILSRAIDVDTIIDKTHKALSVKDADKLFEMVTLEDGYTIPPELLKKYLNSNGMRDPYAKGKRKTTAKTEITINDMRPQLMPKKKQTLPRSSPYHPLYPEQHAQRDRNTVDFSQPGKEEDPEHHNEELDNDKHEEDSNNYGYDFNKLKTLLADFEKENDLIPVQEGDEDQKPLQLEELNEEDIFFSLNSCVRTLINTNCSACKSCQNCALVTDHGPFCSLATIKLTKGHNLRPDGKDNNHGKQELQDNDQDEDPQFESNALECFRLNNKIIEAGEITIPILREAQKSCPHTQLIIKKKPFDEKYFFRSGVLLHKEKGEERIVLPRALLPPMVHFWHMTVWGIHANRNKIHEIITTIYYAKDLRKWMEEDLPNCTFCNTEKINTRRLIKIGRMTTPSYPREMWAADLSFGFEPCLGYTGIIVFVDLFSLYVVSKPVRSKNADELLKIFKNDVYYKFNCKTLHSDRERAIQSEKFDTFCKEKNITQTFCAAFSPIQNSACEISLKLLKTALRIYVKATGTPWPIALPEVTMGFNRRKLTTKYSVEEIMFGNIVPIGEPLECNDNFDNFDTYMDYFIDHTNKIREEHMKVKLRNASQIRDARNKARIDHEFKVGDVVYLKELTIANEGPSKSTRSQYIGPYEVVEVLDQDKHCVIEHMTTYKRRLSHQMHLKPVSGMPILTGPVKTDASKILKQTPIIPNIASTEEKKTTPEPIRRSARIKEKEEKSKNEK